MNEKHEILCIFRLSLYIYKTQAIVAISQIEIFNVKSVKAVFYIKFI